MEFGELKNDTNFVSKITNISESLQKINEYITKCVEYQNYDDLSIQEKIKFDTFMSYTINSLYWMYIKLQGQDPNTHDIKNEISRVRQAMLREKEIHERNTIRPVLDKDAAGRFVKHGLKIRNKKINEDNQKESTLKPPNKKKKFTENLSDDE